MKRVLFALFVFGIFLAHPSPVFAARLSLYPSSALVSPGQTVSVSVIIASSDKAVNAVSGLVNFPTNKLQVLSVSKANSALTLWVEEPSYSNVSGTISFQGVVPNPGFLGTRGTVLTIVFKTLAAGPADISFSQASVLANDGSGTDILADYQGSTINISGQPIGPTKAETQTSVSSDELRITSKTHPVINKWYSNNDVELSWNLPTDVTSTRYSFEKDFKATPSIIDAPAITRKTFENTDEGLWYFRLQIKKDGKWGGVSTFKVYIDLTPPEISIFDLITEDGGKSPHILLKSIDDLSGPSHYRVKFGDRPYETYNAKDNGEQMTIAAKYSGKQTVIIEAYDLAGNKSIIAKELDIKTIEAPKILDVPSILDKGQDLVIRGTAIPDTEIRIYLRDINNREVFESTKSGSAGDFQMIWREPIADGKYVISAEAIDNFGSISPRSNEKDISVHPSILFRIGSWVVTVASFATFAIIVLIGLMYGGLILWKRFTLFRRRLDHEMDTIDRSVHTAFNLLKDEIRHEVKNLQKIKSKRKLTAEEERIIDRFSADVDDAERFIEKQIRDVKKEV